MERAEVKDKAQHDMKIVAVPVTDKADLMPVDNRTLLTFRYQRAWTESEQFANLIREIK